MKKGKMNYEEAELQIVYFDSADVIATSGGYDNEDPDGWTEI